MQFNYVLVFLFSVTTLSAWSSARLYCIHIWKILAALTLCLAVAIGNIEPIAILWVAIPFAAFSVSRHIEDSYFRLLGGYALAMYLLALAMNLLPGFHTIQLIYSEKLGSSQVPFALTYTLAKPYAGLLVFAFIAQKSSSLSELKRVLFSFNNLCHWIFPALILILIAILSGVNIDVKWLPWFPIFILTNFTFTVIQEEAFFRAFMQQPLQRKFGHKLWIIPVVALPFALLHTPKVGANVFAFYSILIVAGIAYGWSYFKTQRIESAIATHLSVNVMHILLLVYPLPL